MPPETLKRAFCAAFVLTIGGALFITLDLGDFGPAAGFACIIRPSVGGDVVIGHAHYDHDEVLIYNAVPKTGSTTLSALMNLSLAEKGGSFVKRRANQSLYGFQGGLSRQYPVHAQVKFLRYALSQPRPFAFRQHIHFVDPTLLHFDSNLTKLHYINYLRDPIERFKSRYYFGRSYLPDKYYHRLYPLLEPQAVRGVSFEQWRAKRIDRCIEDAIDGECNPRPEDSVDFSIPYLCGQHPHCFLHKNRRALSDAISNLERHYAVVGILELQSTSLKVLEATLPTFFANVTRRPKVHRNRISRPPEADLDGRLWKRLRRTLSTEYELYNFARKRLSEQARKLGIENVH